MNCNTLITDVIQCLKEKGLIDGKEADAKTALEELFCDRAFSEWWTEDVTNQLGYHFGSNCISQEDARKVLDYVMQEHDAEVGINWEVIRIQAEYLADRGEITINGYEPQSYE